MRKIQNTNISFRATTDLKKRLTDFCLKNDLHNSFVIRRALASYLRAQMNADLAPSIAGTDRQQLSLQSQTCIGATCP